MKRILFTSTLLGALSTSILLAEAPKVLESNKRTFGQSKFIPDISLIVDGSYVSRSIDDEELAHLELPGIAHGGGGHDGHDHGTYNGKNGFNLNYAELVLSSSVDPYLNLDAVFHFSEEGVEIEEAYFTTTFDSGFRLRGGKLYSAFGRLNQQHHHFWDFGDAPLVNTAFLGDHGLNENGLQLVYVAPFEHYLMAGVEILQGENESTFGLEGIEGVFDDAQAPNLVVGYVKASYDIEDTTILSGISFAQGDSRIDHSTDEEDPHAFSGDSTLYGVDLTVKHAFDSYSMLTWQSEWIKREMQGDKFSFNDGNLLGSANLDKEQSGYYTQLVYALNQNWKAGIRYDNIYQNDVIVNGNNKNLEENLDRISVMGEYHPSEFSRFRLQYNQNNAMYNEEGENEQFHTISLQYNISIGAHGAHAF